MGSPVRLPQFFRIKLKNNMPKLTPKRTFLLRMEEKKSVVAKKGEKIDVTDAEWKKLPMYFREPFPVKKKGVTVSLIE